MTSESTDTAKASETVDATAESPDTTAAPASDALPEPSHAERLARFQEAQQDLAQFFAETSTDYARSCVQKWRAHGLRFAVECPASVCGIVAPNPEAAADSLRAAGFVVLELSMPFAEQAVAAVWERCWWRRHRREIQDLSPDIWMLWPGASLPVDAEGLVVLAPGTVN
jgi:hypothetical protein